MFNSLLIKFLGNLKKGRQGTALGRQSDYWSIVQISNTELKHAELAFSSVFGRRMVVLS
jgi:hypothetical protein